MNRSTVHDIRRSRPRVYFGESEAADLLNWLNEKNPSEKKRLAIANVEEVMALIASAEPETRRIQTRLNHALHWHEFVYVCRYDTALGRLTFPQRPSHDFSMGDWVRGEAEAIARTVKVAEMGVLAQVRKCECGQYFFVRFPKRQPPERFHSKECRERFWSQSDKRKEQKRETAKARYVSRKELELGSRKAAQRKGGKS